MKNNKNYMKYLYAIMIALFLITVGVSLTTTTNQTPDKKMAFTEFQTDLTKNPSSIKTVWYNIASPDMTVEMKDGTKYDVKSPMGVDFRKTLLQQGVDVQELNTSSSGATFMSNLVIFLPLLSIILVPVMMWYFMRQQRRDTGLKMEFLAPSQIKYRMSDVAGVDHAREDMEELITFLKAPKRFHEVGAQMPKGVILTGPAGTGKTMLAKAIAGEAGVPFVAMAGSQFVEKYVGVGASRIRELFAEAKKKAPCIIFIDEIDGVGKARGTNSNSEADHALNQLLVEMDGFNGREGIIVIAATNRTDVLDPALLRPGRFDRRITVGLPDIDARLQILKVHARKRKLTKEATDALEAWARKTTFFSGAKLESLMNEAAIRAVRNYHEAITPHDIDEAFNKIIAGGEKRSKNRHERDKQITAWHEAGHAVLAAYYGKEVPRVTIVPQNDGAGGYTLINREEKMESKKEMRQELAVLMGGRVAEILKFGEDNVTGGASQDLKQATELATTMAGAYGFGDMGLISVDGWKYNSAPKGLQESVNKILADAMTEAKDILTKHRTELDALSEALIVKETLIDDELKPYFTFQETDEPAA